VTKLKQPKHEAAHAHLSIAEDKDAWSFSSIHMIRFHSGRINRRGSFIFVLIRGERHPLARLVEALCYKPEGRGFDSR
jgi:hypothetical protein